MRRTNVQSTQDGAIRVQPLLQVTTGGKPLEAPNHHPEGRLVQSSAGDPRVHVCRRGERVSGAAADVLENRR